MEGQKRKCEALIQNTIILFKNDNFKDDSDDDIKVKILRLGN